MNVRICVYWYIRTELGGRGNIPSENLLARLGSLRNYEAVCGSAGDKWASADIGLDDLEGLSEILRNGNLATSTAVGR